MKTLRLVTLITVATIVAPSFAQAETPIKIFVSVAPQRYFVEQVGKDRVEVFDMVPPGYSPESFEPTSRLMSRLYSSKIYFSIGLPFEHRVLSAISDSSQRIKIVNLGDETVLGKIDHNRGHDHDDPHIWTNPLLVKKMVGKIKETLAEVDPAGAEIFRRESAVFIKELDKLDDDIRSFLASAEHKNFMVYHPSWGHFAKEYGLNQIAIEHQGKEPGARSLLNLIKRGKSEGVKKIFIQRNIDKRVAKAIAVEIGAELVYVDPLSYDYLNNMRTFTRMVAESLQ